MALLTLGSGGERPLFRPRPVPDKSTHLDGVACRRPQWLTRHDADRPGFASRPDHRPEWNLLSLLGRQDDFHLLECPAGLEGGGDRKAGSMSLRLGQGGKRLGVGVQAQRDVLLSVAGKENSVLATTTGA